MSKVTVAFVMWTMLTYTACVNYFWDQDDPLFDCIAALHNTETKYLWTAATFYSKNRLITSRYPIMNAGEYNYVNYYSHLYTVNGTHYNSTQRDMKNWYYDKYCTRVIIYFYNINYPTYTCITDDIFVMDVEFEVPSALQLFDIVNYKPIVKGYRQPFYFPLADKYTPEEPSNWMTASFGMIDKKHMNESNRLIPIYYTEPVLVDCDEYFSHSWGEFICILNLDHYPVIPAGAPLIQNGHIFGVACFVYKKGKESIFAFTDLRKYYDHIKGIK